MTTMRTGRLADGRSLGARVAVMITIPIGIVVAGIPALVALSGNRDAAPAVVWFGALALVGLVVAASVGALFGPRLVRDPAAFRSGSVIAMSTIAMIIGAYLVALALAVTAGSIGPERTVLAWFATGTIGVVAYGLPALMIVVPHALVWRRLMRRSIDA